MTVEIIVKGGGGSVIGDERALYVDDVAGLFTNEAEEWLKTGTVETDTASYPDAKVTNVVAGTYTGVSFATVDIDVDDITWDGSNFWVLGNGNGTSHVRKHAPDGTYLGVFFNVYVENIQMYGITWDGTHFWLVGWSPDEKAYKYTAAGVYTGTSFSVAAEERRPSGITWDGSSFWVVGTITDAAYKYTAAGVYTGTSFSVASEDSAPIGIGWDGTHLWMVGDNNDTAYKYSGDQTFVGSNIEATDPDTTFPIYTRIK